VKCDSFWIRLEKQVDPPTWPTFKSTVGSSKTVFSIFSETFGYLIDQFGDRKIKYILVILYDI
jgi:hypothetical protein